MSGLARFHWCATLTLERIGFRTPKLAFVWYPRRGSVEAWFFRWGALRHRGQWLFTSTGQLVIGLGPLRDKRRTVA